MVSVNTMLISQQRTLSCFIVFPDQIDSNIPFTFHTIFLGFSDNLRYSRFSRIFSWISRLFSDFFTVYPGFFSRISQWFPDVIRVIPAVPAQVRDIPLIMMFARAFLLLLQAPSPWEWYCSCRYHNFVLSLSSACTRNTR